MTTETTQNETTTADNVESNRPDYVAKQYRVVRIEDGWRTRKERIGVAWKAENNAVVFRPSGAQIIEGDIYFYPLEGEPAT